MMNKVDSKKPRELGPMIETLENRNLLTVLPVHVIRSSLIQAVLKPMMEMAPRLNHSLETVVLIKRIKHLF